MLPSLFWDDSILEPTEIWINLLLVVHLNGYAFQFVMQNMFDQLSILFCAEYLALRG